jgi:hypothetical protein
MSTNATSKVNMSLDDIIKQSKGGRGQKKFNNAGGRDRRFNQRRSYKNSEENNTSRDNEEKVEKRTRLFVSDLQKDIVNSELRVFNNNLNV